MYEIWESLQHLINPETLLREGGFYVLLFVVFAETGLFFGFFLPGDYLLFLSGMFVATNRLDVSIWVLIIGLIAAAIAGNFAGYWFGKKSGPFLFHRKDSFLFKKKYLFMAKEFYDKHGGGAIVIARFMPFVRTFAPIVAGIVQMDKKKFMFFNIAGCIAWVTSMILAGHFLQKWILAQFGFDLKEHLEIIVIGIVLITTAPVIVKVFFGKKKPKDGIPPVQNS